MIPDFRDMSVTEFRTDLARQVRWVRTTGGQIFLRNREQFSAALVPIWQARIMADVESWSVKDMRARQEDSLRAWTQLRRNAGYTD